MMVEQHDYIVPSQNLETGKVLLQVQMISVQVMECARNTEADLDSTSQELDLLLLACKSSKAT